MESAALPSRPERIMVEHRLLASGKRLFAAQGFEKTTTAAIARDAGTSESQLLKYFGGKEGLLEAIFVAGWDRISFIFAAASVAAAPPEALRMLFELIVRGFEQDKELRDVMLLEGRRIRSGSEIMLTGGYLRLVEEVTKLLAQLPGVRSRPELRPEAVASGLLGMLEGMLRDQVVAERKGRAAHAPTAKEMRELFALFLHSLAQQPDAHT